MRSILPSNADRQYALAEMRRTARQHRGFGTPDAQTAAERLTFQTDEAEAALRVGDYGWCDRIVFCSHLLVMEGGRWA